jgi:hypothetical protein
VRHTAQRISRILDGRERIAKPLLKPAVAVAAVFGAVSFVGIRHTPRLVGFQNPASSRTTSANRFDYVANANSASAKAFAASLRLRSTGTAPLAKARVPETEKQPVEHSKYKVNRAPLIPRTEEARDLNSGNTVDSHKTVAVVNAAMHDDVPSFVYLVTQTEQYDAFGNVTVMTSIWRIRVMKPAQAANPALPHQT